MEDISHSVDKVIYYSLFQYPDSSGCVVGDENGSVTAHAKRVKVQRNMIAQNDHNTIQERKEI